MKSARYRPVKKVLTWLFFLNFLVLGYVGMKPPFGIMLQIGRIATIYYFLYFILLPFVPAFEKTGNLPREEDI